MPDTSGIWSRGIGFYDKTKADSALGSPASHATTGGFQAGYDFLATERTRVGFSLGYADTSLDVDDRSSSGHSTYVQSGLYAGYQPGDWFMNGSFAYTSGDNHMSRQIVFPGVDERADAHFQNRFYSTMVEGGYHLAWRRAASVEPAVSLRHTHFHQDGFRESGAPGLDLQTDDEASDSFMSSVGLRLNRTFREGSAHPVVVGARSSWDHEWRDQRRSITAQFAESFGGDRFTVEATPQSRDAASLGVDGRIALTRTLQFFIDSSAILSSDQTGVGVSGGVRLAW